MVLLIAKGDGEVKCLLLGLVLVVCGCATQIMKSYIGKDVREVVLDYGQPINALDLADGTRAFQWEIVESFITPKTVNTTAVGSSTWMSSNTTITGGQTVGSHCIYTLIGTWNEGKSAWIITDFRKPKFKCL